MKMFTAKSLLKGVFAMLAVITLAMSSRTMTAQAAPAESSSKSTAVAVPAKVAATRAAMRDLWVGHIFWVPEVVVHLASKDSASATVAEQQVVANAKQIGATLEPFYGKAASDQLFKSGRFNLL